MRNRLNLKKTHPKPNFGYHVDPKNWDRHKIMYHRKKLCFIKHKTSPFWLEFMLGRTQFLMVRHNYFRGSASLHLARKSFRHRYASFTSNEVAIIKRMENNIVSISSLLELPNLKEESSRYLRLILKFYILFYLDATIDRSGISFLKPISRKKVSIQDFDNDECFIYFRFRKPDLGVLFQLLRFPSFVVFDNRIKMLGEEVFLRELYELASGETQFKIARLVFGGDQSPHFSQLFS